MKCEVQGVKGVKCEVCEVYSVKCGERSPLERSLLRRPNSADWPACTQLLECDHR